MSGATAYRIELKNISKSFPGVLANDDVSLAASPGEIHALLGENGAGKSTLVKIIYGIQQPDSGSVFWQGEPVTIANPKTARRMGIGMVFQHFSLFEAMTVLENIELGLEAGVSRDQLEQKVRGVLEQYGLNLDPHRVVNTLSVGERQRIEIVRALLLQPKLLIMDEPTSVLTPQEADQLFDTLRQLAETGCTILYISHKLDEIRQLCDTATILRGGKVVATCDPRKETPKSLAEMMIGSNLKQVSKVAEAKQADIRFQVQNLSLAGEGNFGISLDDISFSVARGELFGIAGVAGNGQNELFLALSGERKASKDNCIRLDGHNIGAGGPGARRKSGMCCVPEERNGHGAVGDFSLAENVVLSARQRKSLVSRGIVNFKAAADYAKEIISRFDVKATGTDAQAGSLSGGNLQKFLVGREILQHPDVLVISQPTWGVDAGAAAAIHQAMLDLAASGSAIIVISQDLDELISICDRLAVMNEGRLSEAKPVADISVEEIGLLMGGIHGEHDDEATAHAA